MDLDLQGSWERLHLRKVIEGGMVNLLEEVMPSVLSQRTSTQSKSIAMSF
jgi:hypothetical protein